MYLTLTNDAQYSQNLTKTAFDLSLAISTKFLPTRTLTGFESQSSGISSVIKWGYKEATVCYIAIIKLTEIVAV